MTDDTTRLFGAQIDEDTYEILNSRLEYGEKSQLIRDLANSIAYGDCWDERTPLDVQIENIEEKLADARRRRREAEADIESYEDELDRLREKRENKQTREERLEASLVPVEADLRGGKRVFADHGAIQSIAREYNLEAAAVLDQLKIRNPDVPDHAFKQQMHTTESWDGVDPEELNTPAEKREEAYR